MAADNADVLAADNADVLAADTTDVLAADNKEAPVTGKDDDPSEYAGPSDPNLVVGI